MSINTFKQKDSLIRYETFLSEDVVYLFFETSKLATNPDHFPSAVAFWTCMAHISGKFILAS